MAYEIAQRIVSGRRAVTVPGTAEKLVAVSTHCFRVDISADVDNANAIVVGGSEIVAVAGSQAGVVLFPGNNPLVMLVDDISKIYVDAINAGDSACYTYYVQ